MKEALMQDIKVGPMLTVHPGRVLGVLPYALALRGSAVERAFYGFSQSTAIKRATAHLTGR